MQTRNSSHATIVARSARGATMNSQVCSTCVPDIMRMVTVFNHKQSQTSLDFQVPENTLYVQMASARPPQGGEQRKAVKAYL